MTTQLWNKHDHETYPDQLYMQIRAQVKGRLEAKGLSAKMFRRAEQYIARAHVETTEQTGRGLIYDPHIGWRFVSQEHCPICNYDGRPGVGHGWCEHKLAVAFAEILAQYKPRAQREAPPQVERQAVPARVGVGGLGQLGGYSARTLGRGRRVRRKTGSGDHQHCPRCGGWLTAEGGCNRCGGV